MGATHQQYSDEFDSQLKTTTNDCTIYQTTFKGNKVLLLQIVDDLIIQCEHEETAEDIFLLIGVALQLPDSCLKTIFQECDPDEGTIDAFKLELSQGFGYHTLLGEMMYAYVTCRPNIGYAITTMNIFSTKPSKLDYELLKGIVKYLQETKDWGIKYT